MFYLTILFLFTWCQIYGKEPRDNEKGNWLCSLHGLLFLISSKGSFICTIPHTMALVTLVVEEQKVHDIVTKGSRIQGYCV